jgi:hypothetical protein
MAAGQSIGGLTNKRGGYFRCNTPCPEGIPSKEENPPRPLPTPSFVRSPGPGGEGDSFGLRGGGSSLEQAGFSRGFWVVLRSRLPLRIGVGWPRDNPFPPGFLIHRSPRRAILVGENWGRASRSPPFSKGGDGGHGIYSLHDYQERKEWGCQMSKKRSAD